MRNTRTNRTGYNTKCLLYLSSIENETEIVRKLDLVSAKVFYAKEYESFKYIQNQYGTMQRVIQEGVIETDSLYKGDVRNNDTVEYEGIKYNVDEVKFVENNAQKEVSRRPSTRTIIKLGAVVDG